MAEKYGVTPQGFIPKRLDEIINEMHDDATESYGFNTRHNPESFLSTTIVNLSDKFAELWEVIQEAYLSHYPSSAKGQSLDDCGQLGGSIRSKKSRTQYMVLCTGKEGTEIKKSNTRVSSSIEPKVYLTPATDTVITIGSCNKCTLRLAPADFGNAADYSISIEGFSFVSGTATRDSLLDSLALKIEESTINMKATVDNGSASISLEAIEPLDTFSIIVSSNFDVVSVSSLVTFQTEEYGNIQLPEGLITTVETSPAGLVEVCDVGSPVAGRLDETDTEYRVSYSRKIFIRSRTMLDSIVSAIWANVPGVKSCAAYQNDTNVWKENRPPHSVEVIVDVGTSQYSNVAKQILATKAAGIQSCHCCGLEIDGSGEYAQYAPYAHEIEVVDETYGNTVLVRFTSPIPILCNFTVTIYPSGDSIAPNTYTLISDIIKEKMEALAPGTSVVPMKWNSTFYEKVPGIDDFDVRFTIENPPDGDMSERKFWTNRNYKFKPSCGEIVITTA